MNVKKVTDAVWSIGVNDTDLDLFESQYPIPAGVSYNSYVILDEKVAVMDTVDARATEPWLENLAAALDGRTPDYLVVSHMEPDHGANVARLAAQYPQIQLVGNAKTFQMMEQFFGASFVSPERRVVVKEGDKLELSQPLLQPLLHLFGAAVLIFTQRAQKQNGQQDICCHQQDQIEHRHDLFHDAFLSFRRKSHL